MKTLLSEINILIFSSFLLFSCACLDSVPIESIPIEKTNEDQKTNEDEKTDHSTPFGNLLSDSKTPAPENPSAPSP